MTCLQTERGKRSHVQREKMDAIKENVVTAHLLCNWTLDAGWSLTASALPGSPPPLRERHVCYGLRPAGAHSPVETHQLGIRQKPNIRVGES